MKIQIVSNDKLEHLKECGISVSPLNAPISLDEFDLNIVDLSTTSLWRNHQSLTNSINAINDLNSLHYMVERRTNSSVLFVYPKNQFFYYGYSIGCQHDYGYQHKKPIKDCLIDVAEIISKALPFAVQPIPIIYENTTTTINDTSYSASFYFEDGYCPLIKSDKSNKTTTISINGDVFLTTMQILDAPEQLMAFVKYILPPTEREVAPQWVHEIRILNDIELTSRINEAQTEIRRLDEIIFAANNELQENSRIKSILYTNGAELSEVVFSILEKLLTYDLSAFVDEKKEDFQIKKDSYTLIGEIKGVTSNIKNEHISQVDVHYQGYMDKLAEEGRHENVHQVLIMNPFRNKPITKREPVHDTQISLAIRNGCLIIETVTLLKLFEKFAAGEIDTAFCEKLFTEKTGLLKDDDLLEETKNG